jgi:hypothetical protein
MANKQVGGVGVPLFGSCSLCSAPAVRPEARFARKNREQGARIGSQRTYFHCAPGNRNYMQTICGGATCGGARGSPVAQT